MAAVICLGIAVQDCVFSVPEIPGSPRKVTASDFRISGGGMAATAAVASARLGGQVAFWGRLGDDAAGADLVAALRAHGVDADAVQRRAGSRSPVSAVLVGPTGERMLAVYRGQLEAAADWLPLERLAATQAVLVDFRWLEGAERLLTAARARGVPSVLDADVGDAAALARLVPLADHVVFSQLGLAEFTGEVDPAQGLRKAAAAAPGLMAVTLGEQGSLFLMNGALQALPAFGVRAVDTNGAGDVFHGAYTLALAEGRAPLAAARFAAAAAALKCAAGGGWDSVPGRTSVDELLKGTAA